MLVFIMVFDLRENGLCPPMPWNGNANGAITII
jgi:hypothetical protein